MHCLPVVVLVSVVWPLLSVLQENYQPCPILPFAVPVSINTDTIHLHDIYWVTILTCDNSFTSVTSLVSLVWDLLSVSCSSVYFFFSLAACSPSNLPLACSYVSIVIICRCSYTCSNGYLFYTSEGWCVKVLYCCSSEWDAYSRWNGGENVTPFFRLFLRGLLLTNCKFILSGWQIQTGPRLRRLFRHVD